MKKSILILCSLALISCGKQEAYNYNIGLKRETYKAGNDAVYSSGWQGHALSLETMPTNEQLMILGFGSSIDAEESLNNGKGYDANVFKSKIVAVEITHVDFDYIPTQSIETHREYKKGLKHMSLSPDKWNAFKKIFTLK
jgi:hypothetical protein